MANIEKEIKYSMMYKNSLESTVRERGGNTRKMKESQNRKLRIK